MEHIHSPTLSIYWADTGHVLSHEERHNVASTSIIIDVTQYEILLEDVQTRRKIVIRGTLDLYAPEPDADD